MSGKLDGKVAIVTGSSQGIGKAIADKFASEGAKLIINDLDAAIAETSMAEINDRGGSAVVCAGDVTMPDFGEHIVSTAMDSFDGLDIIVNNAGYTWDNVIQKISDELFEAMLAIHVTAPFRILRAAQPHFKAQAAADRKAGREIFRKVVNVSSMAGIYGNAGHTGYATAKTGIVGMTKTLAKEWGRFKVNVNAAAFGLVETRLTQGLEGAPKSITIKGQEIAVGIPADFKKSTLRISPAGRGATVEEAAGAVAMLCYLESNHVSGQVVVVAGGASL